MTTMKMMLYQLGACLLLTATTSAFAPLAGHHNRAFVASTTTTTRRTTSGCPNTIQCAMLLDGFLDSAMSSSFWNSASNILLSTIDSDVASVPENEFRSIFLAGMAVAFGGILTTSLSGFLIGARGKFIDLLVEFYGDKFDDMLDNLENDTEFWNKLEEEEREEARKIFQDYKAAKKIWEARALAETAAEATMADSVDTNGAASPTPEKEAVLASGESDSADKDMFSDY